MELTEQDRKGVDWLDRRCSVLVTEIKVRRKYARPGPLSLEEQARLKALFEARDAVRRLRSVLWAN